MTKVLGKLYWNYKRLLLGGERVSNVDQNDIISVLKSEIEDYDVKMVVKETGIVTSIGDGIATIYGLDNVMYGELVEFETGVRGIVQNLQTKTIGCVLLGSDYGLTEGSKVVRTKKRAGVPVSEDLIGRVVDSLHDALPIWL